MDKIKEIITSEKETGALDRDVVAALFNMVDNGELGDVME